MSEKIDANKPKFKAIKELPETLMALILQMWEKELGYVPKGVDNMVITYFDTIYTNRQIPEDIYIHEMVHFVRQGNGKDESLARQFCIQYLENKEFRYKEELLAYREQYKYVAGLTGDRKLNRQKLFEYAKYLARELSSEKYGDLCSFHQALGAIT